MRALFLLLAFLTPFYCSAQTITLVKDLIPGYSSAEINEYKECNGSLYFSMQKGYSSKAALWKTDGDSATTTLIKQFEQTSIYNLTVLNNQLYFIAADSFHGYEIWRSDGTSQGTNMVMDINPTGSSIDVTANPQTLSAYIRVLNNKMFFVANDGTHCNELWVSDGTANGTHLFKDLNPAPPGWQGSCTDVSGAYPDVITEISNNKLYFAGMTAYPNFKLWSTDGTASHMDSVHAVPLYGQLMNYNNEVYFAGVYQDTLGGLVKTDGTETGTQIISPDLQFNSNESVSLNGKCYFVASKNCCSHPYALYSIDPNHQLALIKDSIGTSPNIGAIQFNRKLNFLTVLNSSIYFSGNGVLWKTDGTAGGTTRLDSFFNLAHLIAVNGKLYFKAFKSDKTEIWESDGTTAGTHAITMAGDNYFTLFFYANSNMRSPLYFFKNAIFFTNSYDTTMGKELYKIELFPAVVNEVKKEPLIVYPNPAKDHINLKIEGVAEFIVYDVFGKQVFRSEKSIIDITSLTPGVYFIEADQKGIKRYGRFVKE